jgi:hypothetical protein
MVPGVRPGSSGFGRIGRSGPLTSLRSSVIHMSWRRKLAAGGFKGSRGNAAGKIFRGCALSRSDFVSAFGLLMAGVDVPASGARRLFMFFGDGPMAAAVATLDRRRR